MRQEVWSSRVRATRKIITMGVAAAALFGAGVSASPASAEVNYAPPTLDATPSSFPAPTVIPSGSTEPEISPSGEPSPSPELAMTDTAEPSSSADELAGPPIVYSDLYFKFLAAAPSGFLEHCAAYEIISGPGGVCDASVVYMYFYPDGTLGSLPWYEDPSSPTGWSVGPDPCDGLSEAEYLLWSTYVDFTNGWLAEGPDLTDAQIETYGACWGWWF